jgi:hypothetical protein
VNNFKKAAMTSLVLAGMAMGTAANAATDPTAVVVWTGKVPAINPGDTLIITGVSGSLDPVVGALAANQDGTFVAPTLMLEAHANDGSVDAPTVGALTEATWTVKAAGITYGGQAQVDQVAEVTINGAKLAINESTAAQSSSVSVSIAQTATLHADVSGLDVQASVTLMASTI